MDPGTERWRVIQDGLARRALVEDPLPVGSVRRIIGVDAQYFPGGGACAVAAAVYDVGQGAIVATHDVVIESRVAYVPGYLAFREAPALVEVLRECGLADGDVVLCDGAGVAHPRRAGLATHLGVTLNVPCFGVAKNHLVGEYVEPGNAIGDRSALTIDGDVVGAVVRTRADVKPVFVSAGHLLRLDDAVSLTLLACQGFRLPEPQRAADHHARMVAKRRLGSS